MSSPGISFGCSRPCHTGHTRVLVDLAFKVLLAQLAHFNVCPGQYKQVIDLWGGGAIFTLQMQAWNTFQQSKDFG